MLLGLLDKAKAERGLGRILLVFGRVPLFYYVLHLYLIHTLAHPGRISLSPAYLARHRHRRLCARPLGYGHGLPFIYAMWILAVAILYLPCRWFMELRNRHRDWPWLSYL